MTNSSPPQRATMSLSRTEALSVPHLTCHFKEVKPGEAPRALMLYAKKARGMMVRYAIDSRVDRAEGLKDFDVAGYRFDAGLSGEREWVFTRPHPLG